MKKLPPTRRLFAGSGIDPDAAPSSQRLARILVTLALVLFGLYILSAFLRALVWAVIFAIATWPLYQRFYASCAERWRSVAAPLLFTVGIGVVLIAPMIWATLEVAREAQVVAQIVTTAERSGFPAPDAVAHLPLIGERAAEWWRTNLGDPEAATELLGRLNRGVFSEWTRSIGIKIVHGLAIFAFTLLTLFFIYREGARLSAQLLALGDRLLGHAAERLALTAIDAVHGTVAGLVLVGLGEGILLGFSYGFSGVPHAALFGALSGILAMIPFGAPLIIGIATLLLVALGNMTGAIVVAAFGLTLVFIADHFVRPVLIGGAVRLPFLWVLLGILGGLESLGLLGLFVGPAVMAVLISLWRNWTVETAVAPDAPV